jgi:hypothetical protein
VQMRRLIPSPRPSIAHAFLSLWSFEMPTHHTPARTPAHDVGPCHRAKPLPRLLFSAREIALSSARDAVRTPLMKPERDSFAFESSALRSPSAKPLHSASTEWTPAAVSSRRTESESDTRIPWNPYFLVPGTHARHFNTSQRVDRVAACRRIVQADCRTLISGPVMQQSHRGSPCTRLSLAPLIPPEPPQPGRRRQT